MKEWEDRGEPVLNVESIRQELKASDDIDVSKPLIRKILRKELGLKWIKPKKLQPLANSIKVRV